MEASFPSEDLQQIDQIHMFQLLQARQEDKTIIKIIIFYIYLPLLLHAVNITL